MYYIFTFPPGTETRLDRVPVVTAGITAALLVVHCLFFYFRPTGRGRVRHAGGSGKTGDAVRALKEMRRTTDAVPLPPQPVSRLAGVLLEQGDIIRAADLYELAGRWERDRGARATHPKQAGDIARSCLGDLAARLMAGNRACLNVPAKRLRFAVPAP